MSKNVNQTQKDRRVQQVEDDGSRKRNYDYHN